MPGYPGGTLRVWHGHLRCSIKQQNGVPRLRFPSAALQKLIAVGVNEETGRLARYNLFSVMRSRVGARPAMMI
jgi:hypothetical protein